ncbi:MAG: inositol monophosphatase family protein [Corynebacteriales bacterium]|nr:inositol monophosphatase family protein [Mycobacteriales bacterium]
MDIASLWQELERVLLPTLASYRSHLATLHVERKHDNTLLSEADLAVQNQIIECVRAFDGDGLIIAEEDSKTLSRPSEANPGGRIWIIDPIDGTAQFVAPESREFCSVVCLVEDHKPVAAFVLAPEIGPNRSSVCVKLNGPGEPIEINGQPAPVVPAPSQSRHLSVPRGLGSQPRKYEPTLLARGYEPTTRVTSDTLHMVRTSVDLSSFTDPTLGPFGLFYREQQKVWDGAAGMCLALAAGLFVGDGTGRERASIDVAFNVAEPKFESMLIASDSEARRIVVSPLDATA